MHHKSWGSDPHMLLDYSWLLSTSLMPCRSDAGKCLLMITLISHYSCVERRVSLFIQAAFLKVFVKVQHKASLCQVCPDKGAWLLERVKPEHLRALSWGHIHHCFLKRDEAKLLAIKRFPRKGVNAYPSARPTAMVLAGQECTWCLYNSVFWS